VTATHRSVTTHLGRPPWQMALLAAVAGGLLPLGFAPFGFWFVIPVAYVVVTWCCVDASPKLAFLRSYLFGLGMFGIGVSWISESFQYNQLHGPLVAFLTAGFVAFLALFPALWGWSVARVSRRISRAWVWLAYAPAAWILVEWLRGWLFTGFTWMQVGYSTIDTPLSGLVPILGVYGAGWSIVLSGAAIVCGAGARNVLGGVAVAGAVMLWGLAAALNDHQWTTPIADPIEVALIQGNYAQDVKWLPENLGKTLHRYATLTDENADAKLIVWPETSVPQLAHRAKDFFDEVGDRARANNSIVLAGVPYADVERGLFHNSVVALGAASGVYHKRHLVPFGEYVPWAGVVRPIMDMLGVPAPSFTPYAGPQALLGEGKVQIGLTICYEAAFGSEVAQSLPAATILVNVSNDAWFGDTLAPHQHLQLTRMRARETGRYLLRATNTGISAVIGPDGTVHKRSPQFVSYVLRAKAELLGGLTPHSRTGDWPAIIMALVVALSGLAFSRRDAMTEA
jgi:apolipoprotein N-acyltransferase